MHNIAQVIKRYVAVRIFLAITLSLVMAVMVGSGLQAVTTTSNGSFDAPAVTTTNNTTSKVTTTNNRVEIAPDKSSTSDPLSKAVTDIGRNQRDAANPNTAEQAKNNGSQAAKPPTDPAKNQNVPVEIVPAR